MKNRGISALLLGSALLVLCGCGGGTPALDLSANWYSNTTDEKIEGTREHLEYAITLNGEGGFYGVRYDDGASFVSDLSAAKDDSGGTVYKLTSERNISGNYFLGDTVSEKFEDYTHSEVLFASVRDGLRPIRSTVTMHTSVPTASPTAEKMFDSYRYEYTTEYDASLSTAHFVLQYFDAEDNPTDKIEEDIKLGEAGTYLDNEQIAFALRGVSFSGSVSFHSIDPQTRINTPVAISQTPTAVSRKLNCEIDGVTNEETVNALQVTLSYSSTQAGPSRTLIYAQKGDALNNTYRNVLIYFDYDVQQLGKICYTLKKATFAVG